MSARWSRVLCSRDGEIEIWELHHRAGAVLAEMYVFRAWVGPRPGQRRGWHSDHRSVIDANANPHLLTRSLVSHRRELRAVRARIQAELALIETNESPVSLADVGQLFAEEYGWRITNQPSLRALRRARRSQREAA